MKQKLFLVAAASLALASCSQDEVTELNCGRAIDFRAETKSRGVETTTANIEQFTASAFNGENIHFADVIFSKQGDSFFKSAEKYYWPSNNAELSFVAYAPAKTVLGGTLSLTASEQTLTRFKPTADVGKQVDFVYAKATGSKTANETSGVALKFNHALSQIGIKAKNGGSLVYKVAGIKICNAKDSGDFNFKTDTWTVGTEKASYTVELTDTVTLADGAVSIMGDGGNAMLVPQQLTAWNNASDAGNEAGGAYLAVKVNIANEQGVVQFPKSGSATDYAWVAVPVDTNWEAGKKYTYTLDFTNGAGSTEPSPENPSEPALGSPIMFTVTVGEWTSTDEIEKEL